MMNESAFMWVSLLSCNEKKKQYLYAFIRYKAISTPYILWLMLSQYSFASTILNQGLVAGYMIPGL